MRRATSRHTETLLRAYLGLLAISVVLSGVLIQRHVGLWRHPHNPGREIIVTGPAAAHGGGPTINWGGQKR